MKLSVMMFVYMAATEMGYPKIAIACQFLCAAVVIIAVHEAYFKPKAHQ